MKTLRIDPNGDISADDLDFDGIRTEIGGWIETRYRPTGVAFFDEDGLMKRLPDNPLASHYAEVGLVGTVFVVGDSPGSFTDVPDAAINEINRIRKILVKTGDINE